MKKIAILGFCAGALFFTCDSDVTEPPDSYPITITSPEHLADVSGVVTVTTEVGAGYSLNRVDFYVDGDSVYSDATYPFTYEWDTSIYADGSEHTLMAKAFDDTSSYVSVTVRVTVVKPTLKDPITISSPLDNSSVYGTVNVRTIVGDGFTFLRVDFYVDGDSLFSDSTLPYEYLWDTDIYSDSSQHFLQAKAYDTIKVYSSDTVFVTVIRPLPITITSPADSAIVSGTVTVQASASAGYTFDRVDFYVDDDSVSSDASSPYTYEWDTSVYSDNSQHQLKAVAHVNSTSYVSNTVTVTVVDGQPGEFVYISTFSLSSPGVRVATEGGHLYVAVGGDGMYVIDVSNPGSPSEMYRYYSPGNAQGVDSDSPHLVLADGDNGVQLFDVSDPDTVMAEGSFNTPGLSWNIKVSGSMVYIADYDALQIASISGGNINPIYRLPITDGQVKDVDAVGDIVFVLDVNGLTVVDVSQPASPSVLSRYASFDGSCQSVSATADYVFVGTSTKLAMLSTANLSNLIEVAGYSIASGITGVFAINSIVFISRGASNGGAMALDYSSGSSLDLVSSYIINETTNDITAAGGYVYLAGQTKVDILRF